MNTRNFWKVEIVFGLAAVSTLLGLAFGVGGLRVNLTASLPRGIYRLVNTPPQRGDLVTFCLGSDNPFCGLAKERGYVFTGSCPSGLQPILKKLTGLPDDFLEVKPAGLVVNGKLLPGTVRPDRDSSGRELPPSLLANGPIPDGLALVLSQEHPGSFDSRHFGLVPLSSLRVVEPVWLWERDSVVAENVIQNVEVIR
jgi:conjugative transfer signal peptidase TraF